MERRIDPVTRDRALQLVRRATLGGVATALGLSGIFTAVAAHTFPGQPVAKPLPRVVPSVPVAAVPVQGAPTTPVVIDDVRHHPAQGYSGAPVVSSGTVPRGPGQAPVAAPAFPPAPAPVCHSTPSHPC
jgi:hypothetical protein